MSQSHVNADVDQRGTAQTSDLWFAIWSGILTYAPHGSLKKMQESLNVDYCQEDATPIIIIPQGWK